MKKLLVGTVLVGLAVGAYFVFKDKKREDAYSKAQEDNVTTNPEVEEEPVSDKNDEVKEMYEVKEVSAEAIHDRHTEAASIMADSFKNIMEEVEPIDNLEDSVEPIIDSKYVETMQELDSLSDELDELLK